MCTEHNPADTRRSFNASLSLFHRLPTLIQRLVSAVNTLSQRWHRAYLQGQQRSMVPGGYRVYAVPFGNLPFNIPHFFAVVFLLINNLFWPYIIASSK